MGGRESGMKGGRAAPPSDTAAPTPPPSTDRPGQPEALLERPHGQDGDRQAQVGHGVQGCVAVARVAAGRAVDGGSRRCVCAPRVRVGAAGAVGAVSAHAILFVWRAGGITTHARVRTPLSRLAAASALPPPTPPLSYSLRACIAPMQPHTHTHTTHNL
jgi:hypothetical protein